jgi:cytolysin-activating lysine-acyltransferase
MARDTNITFFRKSTRLLGQNVLGGKSMINVQTGANDHDRHFAEKLGTAAMLMGSSREYMLFQIVCLRMWIEPAIRHKQIQFYYDECGKPMGYLAWAMVAPDVADRLVNDPRVVLHESEWNEGDILWIIDFVAPHGRVLEMVSHAKEKLFNAFPECRYVRRDAAGNVRKLSIWRRRAS